MTRRLDVALERRALEAFEDALAWPPETREPRLRALHADEPALLEAVLGLLKAEGDAELMPTQPPESGACLGEVTPPERVGPYRLTDLIGRGGMGVVYRGERADGLFEQTVAIKLIRTGLFSTAAAEQFLVERRILARLRHPHIAQLFDGGVTDEGLSYIVMELIAGAPITDYARARNLPLRDRLALFLDACDAIQYAHQQLVAHADIKPSNIVVDDRYGVKLLDFGIGRLLEDAAEEPPAGSSGLGMTPAFSSPQQIRGERPTPADDIFALGVLLARLVEGCDGVDADLRAVADKASAPLPEARYATAAELAADVGRWLGRYPVEARPAGRAHAAAMFWRRRWLPISVIGLTTAGLVAAIVVTSVLYIQAEQARRQAERRFEEVHALSRYMLRDLTDELERVPGAGYIRHDLASRARTYLEGLSHVSGASIELRLEAAQGYAKTGEILAQPSGQNLGDPVAGKAALARAEAELRRLHAAAPARADIAQSLADTLVTRASVMAVADNDSPGALKALGEACAMLDRLASQNPGSVDIGLDRWRCALSRADVLNNEGRFAEMVPLLEAALARGRVLAAAGDRLDARPLLESNNLNLLGDARYFLGDKAAALATYQESAGVLEAALRRRADVRLYDRLAFTRYDVASTLTEMGRKDEALAWAQKALDAAVKLRAFEDSTRAHHIEDIVTLQVAVALADVHRYDEAIAQGRANIASRRARADASPNDYEARRSLPVGMRTLADIYNTAGRKAEACAVLAETRAAWAALAKSGGLTAFDRDDETKTVDRLLQACR